MSTTHDPGAAIGSRIANRMFGSERWAREALARHAGRTFSVRVGPLSSRFLIGADGELAAAPASAVATDLELAISPLDVPALLADPARWSRYVTASGDAALAATLQELAQTLPWFVERAFDSVLGPVVGQRVADAGRSLLSFPEYASERLGESVVSYARDEADLVVPGSEMRVLADQAAAVSSRVDALAERIERLSLAMPPLPR